MGMWRALTKEEVDTELQNAINFTGDNVAYGNAMRLVIQQWSISCEHHLTDNAINQKAWIGHAACCLKHGWSEGLVRMAWGYLTKEQQDLANNQAEEAIKIWLSKNSKDSQLSMF